MYMSDISFCWLGGKQLSGEERVFATAVYLENLWQDECLFLGKHQNTSMINQKRS
jgi:hypothetical protein